MVEWAAAAARMAVTVVARTVQAGVLAAAATAAEDAEAPAPAATAMGTARAVGVVWTWEAVVTVPTVL